MPQTQWNSSLIRQCEKKIGQAMLSDEHSLFLFAEDFGKLATSKPSAVCAPQNTEVLQKLLHFANQYQLPLVVRGKGLSQCGQSLPVTGGITVHLEHFNQVGKLNNATIEAQANATWQQVLEVTLPAMKAPWVMPYNCNLSIGGVISAGGVGASSFKYGTVASHIAALEVITADGGKHQVTEQDELFKVCIAGQGRFGVITKATIKLRACKKMVRTFFLVYHDKDQWVHDLYQARDFADGIESFCTPAIQGAKLSEKGRFPFAEWLYALHIAVEYDDKPMELAALKEKLQPWKVLHQQDEPIDSYFLRHDSRFKAMKMIGQWDLPHPWYECFVPATVVFDGLEELLAFLPVHYANVVQIIPLAPNSAKGFLMMPATKEVCAVMILNPGLHANLLPSVMAAIAALDERFLLAGGKRYLSGFLGKEVKDDYWQAHYGDAYQDWINIKNKYDPNQLFRSYLYP